MFLFNIDTCMLELITECRDKIPFWAKLDYHQCPNCPLSVADERYCPLCFRLVPIVDRLGDILSYDTVLLEVETPERTISQSTSMQRALGSMMGLIIAVSGCPHASYFKPMARFHLPLATEEETVYRAVSMYMLAQYFLQKSGTPYDEGLNRLKEIYSNIHQMNIAIVKRLKAAVTGDSSVNAVIMLDMYTKCVPYIIDESLEEIRYLFQDYAGIKYRETKNSPGGADCSCAAPDDVLDRH